LFIPVEVKTTYKQNLKEIRAREMYTDSLYWFTLNPRATTSPHKLLGFYYATKTDYNTNHQKSDLEPFKKHTPFGTKIRTPSDSTLTLNYKNTVIKKEENRIHLVLQRLKIRSTPQSYSTDLKIQSLK